jgi:predicted TIM-barrel fold metal-dependent hydrolase
MLRHLPEPVRSRIDELSGLAPLPALLVESTALDLTEAMEQAGVDRALVIAHPPYMPNELVLEESQKNDRFIPVVFVPSGTSRPGQALKNYHEQGARVLKIHPASDGEGVDSPRYKALLKAAAELDMPVILHTGCIHSHVLYKDPEQGQAQRFAPWFENFRSLKFILAHMNYHEPNIALDLAEEYPNLYVDTSWQPAEVIGEAVRRIDASRVLFGTDWPFVGNNLKIGIQRIEDAVGIGMLNEEQSKLILGENAAKLLGIHAD